MRTISHEFARRSVIRDEAGRVVKRRKGYMGHVIIICQAIVHGCEEEAAEIEQQQQIKNQQQQRRDQQARLHPDGDGGDGGDADEDIDLINDNDNDNDNSMSTIAADNDNDNDNSMSTIAADNSTSTTASTLQSIIEGIPGPTASHWMEFVTDKLATATNIQSTPLGGFDNSVDRSSSLAENDFDLDVAEDMMRNLGMQASGRFTGAAFGMREKDDDDDDDEDDDDEAIVDYFKEEVSLNVDTGTGSDNGNGEDEDGSSSDEEEPRNIQNLFAGNGMMAPSPINGDGNGLLEDGGDGGGAWANFAADNIEQQQDTNGVGAGGEGEKGFVDFTAFGDFGSETKVVEAGDEAVVLVSSPTKGPDPFDEIIS